MRLLELFSGTGSIGRAFEALGWEVTSLDLEGEPTIKCDILDWDHTKFPPGHFQVVWASPVCCEFSKALTRSSSALSLHLVRGPLAPSAQSGRGIHPARKKPGPKCMARPGAELLPQEPQAREGGWEILRREHRCLKSLLMCRSSSALSLHLVRGPLAPSAQSGRGIHPARKKPGPKCMARPGAELLPHILPCVLQVTSASGNALQAPEVVPRSSGYVSLRPPDGLLQKRWEGRGCIHNPPLRSFCKAWIER